MDNYKDAMQYIETQEATEISYVKIGDNNKKLVVSFASNAHTGFEQKKSLMQLKYQRNDFDVLYFRNKDKWYLGGLNGIGKNINHTIAFLKKEFSKYDKVLCNGFSAGGYASLLFGSLLKVNKVITINAQTDLEYVNNKLNIFAERANECPITWNKYNKIVNVLNDVVSYNVYYEEDDHWQTHHKRFEFMNLVLHGNYHYNEINHFPTVSKFNSEEEVIPLIEEFLEE